MSDCLASHPESGVACDLREGHFGPHEADNAAEGGATLVWRHGEEKCQKGVFDHLAENLIEQSHNEYARLPDQGDGIERMTVAAVAAPTKNVMTAATIAELRAESATLREKLAKAEQEVERANAAETLMHGECATAWSKASALEKQLAESCRAQEAARTHRLRAAAAGSDAAEAVAAVLCEASKALSREEAEALIVDHLRAAARSAPTPEAAQPTSRLLDEKEE